MAGSLELPPAKNCWVETRIAVNFDTALDVGLQTHCKSPLARDLKNDVGRCVRAPDAL